MSDGNTQTAIDHAMKWRRDKDEFDQWAVTPDGLRALAAKATPGDWTACSGAGSRRCSCGQVWSKDMDAPIATAHGGEWGDDYPALRQVRDINEGGLDGVLKVEAFMERIVYGEIPKDCAPDNSAWIAAASPKTVLRLLDEIDALKVRISEMETAPCDRSPKGGDCEAGSVHESAVTPKAAGAQEPAQEYLESPKG